MSNKNFVVKDTKKYGRGIFASRNIAKGEVIHIMRGKKMGVFETWKRILQGKVRVDDPLQIGMRTHMILDSTSRLFNHSCDPNAGIRKNTELFALKDILNGGEITFDYSLTSSPTDSWSMKCQCGAKICRKIIGDIRSVPKKRLAYYKQLGALQTYMKKLLNRIKNHHYTVTFYDSKAIQVFTNHIHK